MLETTTTLQQSFKYRKCENIGHWLTSHLLPSAELEEVDSKSKIEKRDSLIISPHRSEQTAELSGVYLNQTSGH